MKINKNTVVLTVKSNCKRLVVRKSDICAAAQDKDVRLYLKGGQYFVLEEAYKDVAKAVESCGKCIQLHSMRGDLPRIAVADKIMGVEDDDAAECSYVYLSGGQQYIRCAEDSDYVESCGWGA